MQPTQLSKEGKQLFQKIEFDEKEKLVCEVHKHPFGLYAIYAGGVMSAIVVLVIFVIAGQLTKTSSPTNPVSDGSNLSSLLAVGGGFLALFIIVATAIGAYLYKRNIIILTSEKVAQQLSATIFSRKISQLGIGDVQDVTVTQKGIFAHMFNFGTLVIETAGEQQNYTFTYTPDPYKCAKDIVSSREQDIQKHGN